MESEWIGTMHVELLTCSSFLILFILFVIALEYYELETINIYEKVFMVYAGGFCLEKLAAMHEHGLRGMYNVEKSLEIGH